MVKPITDYTQQELEDKIKAIKAERERTANALKKYEEELERRKQEVPLGAPVPLEDIMSAHIGDVYKYAFTSEESRLMFSARLNHFVNAIQKLAKGEPIDIQVLLPLLKKGWVAMDESCFWYWHKSKPSKGEQDWRTKDDIAGDLVAFNLKPAENWKTSLMECGL